jgi:amino-acid N-acetyltransferase
MIRQARAGDVPEVKRLLESAGLPTAGLDDHLANLHLLEADGVILGAAAFEAYPPCALLRSLVVSETARGLGRGRELMQFVLSLVKRRGFSEAYALTTTIPDWLPRLGFEEIGRADLPAALGASAGLQGACPVTARVFRLKL